MHLIIENVEVVGTIGRVWVRAPGGEKRTPIRSHYDSVSVSF
jgi:hypothetical protein